MGPSKNLDDMSEMADESQDTQDIQEANNAPIDLEAFMNKKRTRRGILLFGLGLGLAGGLAVGNASADDRRMERRERVPAGVGDDEGEYTEEEYKRLTISGVDMCPDEIERMEKAQKGIFKVYFNPDTILFFRSDQHKAVMVDDALLEAMKYPHDLEYKASGGSINITRRTKASNSVGDINITVDGHGRVTQVQGEDIPYSSRGEYNELYKKLDYPQWKKGLIRAVVKISKRPFEEGLTMDERIEEINKRLGEALGVPSEKLKMLYEIQEILMPARLQRMVEARNHSVRGFDEVHRMPYDTFKKAQAKNATSYEDMMSDFFEKFQPLTVTADTMGPEKDNIYIIRPESEEEEPLAVNEEGLFVRMKSKIVTERDENDKKVLKRKFTPIGVDPRYRGLMKKKYYGAHPSAVNMRTCK